MKRLTSLFAVMGLSLAMTGNAMATFPDVPASSPYYDAINYLQAEGIVGGYPDGTFKENNDISRVEFTKIMMEAVYTDEEIAACKTSPFSDVAEGQWFTPYVCIAEKNNVIDGYPDGTFKLEKTINLVEAAKIVVNNFGYQVASDALWYKPYVQKLDELNALPVSLKSFDDEVTRGIMAEITFRILAKVTDKSSTTYQNLENKVMGKEYTEDEVTDMAIDYNDNIVDIHNKAIDEYNAYVDYSSGEPDLKLVEEARQDAVAAIQKIKDELSALPGFMGDFSLRDGFAKDLQQLIDMLNKEEKALVDIWVEIEGGNDSQANLDKEQDLYDTIEKISGEAYAALEKTQKAFADKYGFELEPLEQLDPVDGDESDVIAYNDAVVALQTEAYDLREAYITLADNTPLDGGDFEALEQDLLETIEAVEAVQQELKAMDAYKGDASLRDAFVDYIDMILNTLENEEKELIVVWKEMSKDPDNISDSLVNQEAELLDSITKKDELAYSNLNAAQQAFADKHGYELEQ